MTQQIAEKLLNRPLIKEDGIDLKLLEEVEYLLGLKLPQALKDFYLCVGNLDTFTNSFERFVNYDKLYFINDKLVFLEENQDVCCWGIDAKEANPLVYMCTDESEEWYPEEVRLSEFLVIMLYYQFAQGGYEYSGSIDEKQISDEKLENLTREWEKVVDHNRLIIYWQSGKLIWYFTDETGHLERTGDFTSVFVSMRTEQQLREMEAYGFKAF
jgi:hypothetical protein